MALEYARIDFFCGSLPVGSTTDRNERLRLGPGLAPTNEAVIKLWTCPRCGWRIALPWEDEFGDRGSVGHFPRDLTR